MAKVYKIGIDIGGTNTVVGIIDNNNEILAYDSIKTQEYSLVHKFAEALLECIKRLSKPYCVLENLKGVGIGVPNGNFFDGSIANAPNLPWHGVINIKKVFEDCFKTPVIITNDAKAAALGEMLFGSAKGVKDFIMLTLGTGVGSGFVVGGRVLYGHNGLAGELGHTTYIPEGRYCSCGKKGCLEAYASASGVVKTAKELLAQKPTASILRNKPSLSSKDIAKAASDNDMIAIETLDKTARILALKLADCVALTAPEKIILFGGLSGAGNAFINPLRKYFDMFLLDCYKTKVSIELSALKGNDAAILGAASLLDL